MRFWVVGVATVFSSNIFVVAGLERNPGPAIAGDLNFKSSVKRKPLLFLTPSVNLAQSIEVDTQLPLENQE